VCSQVAIAEVELVDPAEDGEPFQGVKRLAAKSPAFCGIDDAGQRVRHDVKIGGNFQSMERDVVAGVDDSGEACGISDIVEAKQQLGGAYAAG
jgi:hypothetical protein